MARLLAALSVIVLLTVLPAARQDVPASAAELSGAIDRLGAFEFDVRTNAARTVRRAPAAAAVSALSRAVREHRDEYVRYRALVLLAGLGDAVAADLMRAAVADRNDRMRTVAFAWFEHHPDPAMLPSLLKALDAEQSEFVRPALTRAVAAQGNERRAQEALVPLVLRGQDFFRGSVIEALGDYRATWAASEIADVARLDGPLQDDAITAIGKLGDPAWIDLLVALQREVPRELQPTVSASLCLLGRNCPTHETFIKDSLQFAVTTQGYQSLLRGAVHALGMLATRGREDALTALFDYGVKATDLARESIALGIGLVVLRTPEALLRVLEPRADRDAAIELLRDAFDMLSEDFEEERFYVEVRRAYWAAPEGSRQRELARVLIEKLEF